MKKIYKDNYNKIGICRVDKFFSYNQIERLRKYVNYIEKTEPKKGEIAKYFEENISKEKKNILMRAEYFYDYHSGLKDLINSKKIKKYLKYLINYECSLFKEKINYKSPGSRADKLHQDSQGGWGKYAQNFISILISLDKSVKENGCLEFDISGNNCKELIGEKWKPLKVKNLKNPKFKKFELNIGDVVFFNNFVPHRSGPNLSKMKRRQIYLTYNRNIDGNFRKSYFYSKRKNFPPNNERSNKKKYKYLV